MLIDISWLTDYRVYESLFSLIQAGRIVPLSERYSNSIQAAINKNGKDTGSRLSQISVSLLATAGIAVLIIFMGFLSNRFIFNHHSQQRISHQNQLQEVRSQQKTAIAVLQYHSEKGKPPQALGDLKENSYLSGGDMQHRKLRNTMFDSVGNE
jgi:hypothetical protein